LTGERLFSGENDYQAVERVRNVDVQPPSSINRLIPSSLEAIVLKALAKHPRDRYQSAQDMGRALAAFVAESQSSCTKADLGAYMERVFADELAAEPEPIGATPVPGGRETPPRKDPTPAPQVAASHSAPTPAASARTPGPSTLSNAQSHERRAPVVEALTGLAAFDDLEPPSALNVMPEPPPAPIEYEAPEAWAAPASRAASTPSMAGQPRPRTTLSQRHVVPPLVPRAESIPGLPAGAFLDTQGGGTGDPGPDLRAASGVDGVNSVATSDMDWDDDEPRTQSLALNEMDPLPETLDDDVTRQVRIDETFAGLESHQSGAFPPTLDQYEDSAGARPVHRGGGVAAAAPRYARADRAEPRNHVLVIAVVFGIVVIIAAALYTFRAPGTATLRFTTEPKDAVVTVDGVRVSASSSPFVIDGLPSGVEHTISVAKPGYVGWSTKISVHGDKVLDLPAVSLDREVSALPERPAPVAPPTELQPPARRLRVPAGPTPSPGQPPRVRSANPPVTKAPAGGTPKAPDRAARAPGAGGKMGTLRINTRPWSRVLVDGKLIGNTPQMNIPLAAGTHKVKLVNTEFGLSQSVTVEIVAGQTLTKVLTLQ
jgi:hypothetical protein